MYAGIRMYLSILLLRGIWVVSSLGLLWKHSQYLVGASSRHVSLGHLGIVIFLNNFFKDSIFLERGGEREKHRCARGWLLLTYPQLGTWPTTQACALTGNRTGDLSVCRQALNPLSLTSQGTSVFFFFFKEVISTSKCIVWRQAYIIIRKNSENSSLTKSTLASCFRTKWIPFMTEDIFFYILFIYF